MILGVLKDIKAGENRVICTPTEIASIVAAGHTVLVEKDAGKAAGFSNEKYAAMGAKVAAPERQVIAVCGDGSFQMSMMELATMCQHQIPVKIVVLKNAVLGMVREYQHFTYKDNYSMIDLSGSPDLAQLSKAYNIPFLRLENMDACDQIIDEFLAEDTSMILECIIDPMDLVAY